jgi:hypothetical protein
MLSGCATVNSTAAYYSSYSSGVYPAKPAEAVIPILTKFPSSPYTAIGRLAFESGRGWLFLRKSVVYNARVHGADAVVLRSANTRHKISFRQFPPQIDWVPTGPGEVSMARFTRIGCHLSVRATRSDGLRSLQRLTPR